MEGRSKSSMANGRARTSASACRSAILRRAPTARRPMQPRFLILCVALLTGCSTLPGTRPAPVAAATTSAETVRAELLAGYIRSLQTVVQGSLTERAELLEEARRGYEQ